MPVRKIPAREQSEGPLSVVPDYLIRYATLRQLQVFEAIVRLGSVTRAAEELCLTQPTVSMQVKKLADVFEQRQSRGVGQLLDLHGDRRLGQKEFLRGPGEAAETHDCLKHLQLAQRGVANEMVRYDGQRTFPLLSAGGLFHLNAVATTPSRIPQSGHTLRPCWYGSATAGAVSAAAGLAFALLRGVAVRLPVAAVALVLRMD